VKFGGTLPLLTCNQTTTIKSTNHSQKTISAGAMATRPRTLPQTMPVDAAERRQRGGAGAARRPRNAEVEGVQRSAAACARDDAARGASAREGLQQAVAGVNAMADGASGEASAAALGAMVALLASPFSCYHRWKQTSCDGWLIGEGISGIQDEMCVPTWHTLLPFTAGWSCCCS